MLPTKSYVGQGGIVDIPYGKRSYDGTFSDVVDIEKKKPPAQCRRLAVGPQPISLFIS